MKAQELRIGNLVYFFKDTPCIVGVISFKELYLTHGNGFISPKTEEVEPIPLTEEWLLKFGFEYVGSPYQNYKIKAGDYYNSIKFYEGEWCYNNDSSDAGCYFVMTIEHVHQLQNLYFALTGEELTLKTL